MKFKAELKGVKHRKSASLDNIYSLLLVTDDGRILDLGKIKPDTIFNVTVEPEEVQPIPPSNG